MNSDIRIVHKEPGSVKLTLELSHSQAEALRLAVEAGRFEEYSVVVARLKDRDEPAGDLSTSRDDAPFMIEKELSKAQEKRSGSAPMLLPRQQRSSPTRYFIEIEQQDGRYEGLRHQGNPAFARRLSGLP